MHHLLQSIVYQSSYSLLWDGQTKLTLVISWHALASNSPLCGNETIYFLSFFFHGSMKYLIHRSQVFYLDFMFLRELVWKMKEPPYQSCECGFEFIVNDTWHLRDALVHYTIQCK
jgi:hypothetical protein